MPIVCVDAVKENLPNVIEFVTKMLGENADGKLVFELELICEEVQSVSAFQLRSRQRK